MTWLTFALLALPALALLVWLRVAFLRYRHWRRRKDRLTR